MMDKLVVSLEVAKKLKKAGWQPGVEYVWRVPVPDGVAYVEHSDRVVFPGSKLATYPAPTAQELADELPNKLKIGRKLYALVLTNSTTDGSWVADYLMADWQTPLPERGMEVWLHHGDRAKETEADTMADALGLLWLKLREQE